MGKSNLLISGYVQLATKLLISSASGVSAVMRCARNVQYDHHKKNINQLD